MKQAPVAKTTAAARATIRGLNGMAFSLPIGGGSSLEALPLRSPDMQYRAAGYEPAEDVVRNHLS
jgi:hypothetical protein